MMAKLFKLSNPMRTWGMILASICLLSLSGFSQKSEERVLFIQVKDLTPDDYFKISNSFDKAGEIYLKQACVPAEVIMFGISPSNKLSLDENYNTVKGVVLEKTTLTRVSILAEYTEKDFLERCKMFRTGATENQ